MSLKRTSDEELDASTNRVMLWGVGLLAAMVLVFPLYLNYEPSSRERSRSENLDSLAKQGSTIWKLNCSACHGADGEGLTAPALNSKQFMDAATDEQMLSLVSVGVPGTPMPAFGQDFAGPLTSEQVEAVVAYVRSWSDGAPDRPDWRSMVDGAATTTATTTTVAGAGDGPGDASSGSTTSSTTTTVVEGGSNG